MSPAGPLEAVKGRTGRRAETFIQTAEALGVAVILDEPMAPHCTFRIGGTADLYAVAGDIRTLEWLGDLATKHSLPVTVLGGGSNVLVSDHGIRGLVIANQTRAYELRPIPIVDGDHVELVADSGVALAGLARWAIREGWSGLEWAVSIPGTVGGAVIGNAGAHGGQIADNLAWVLVTSPGSGRGPGGEVMTVDQLKLGYRDSILRRGLASGGASPMVLQAGFRVTPGNVAEMTALADSYLAKRRASQPVEPSAGSIFRNPPGDYAGRLVEAAGLKGHRIGGAQVSPRHANFIVNTGNARAVEVADLIRLIQNRVFENSGVRLAPEILYLGDWMGARRGWGTG
jgi:UDP-N-acetylmuramate dehydrogenase